ncbi:MAG: hypothetical protein MUC47_00740 [Candidatus Kapabacteria bacterium]|nr:hypothetical protein [Candidatus Kapabacteria bacterium]
MKLLFLGAKSVVAVLCLVTILAGCSTDEETTAPPAVDEIGSIRLKIDNVYGTKELALGANFMTAGSETITIETLKYFVSNVRLQRTDGTTYVVPQDASYFLIDEAIPASQRLRLDNVPAGDYAAVTFTIGVDSLRSTMDVTQRTGALDVGGAAAGMYWTWNSGYIFFKMEGEVLAAGTNPKVPFILHIGGFGGLNNPTVNNIRSVTLRLPETARVRAGNTPEVHILADVAKMFALDPVLSLRAKPVIMLAQESVDISRRYASMFSVDHVH